MDEVTRNRQIVIDLFAAAQAGEDISHLLADDAEWWVPGDWTFGGTHPKDALADIFGQVIGLLESNPRFTFHAITAEGDRVAVDCESEARFKDGGRFFNTYHFLFVLRDGKVVKVKEHMDTLFVGREVDSRLKALA